jgi:hypothetical protein
MAKNTKGCSGEQPFFASGGPVWLVAEPTGLEPATSELPD